MTADVGNLISVSCLVLIEKLHHHLVKVHLKAHSLDVRQGTVIELIHFSVLNKDSVKAAFKDVTMAAEMKNETDGYIFYFSILFF